MRDAHRGIGRGGMPTARPPVLLDSALRTADGGDSVALWTSNLTPPVDRVPLKPGKTRSGGNPVAAAQADVRPDLSLIHI